MNKIGFIFSAFIFIVACSENNELTQEKAEEIIINTQIGVSKLDTILGDKILDESNNIRLNNFESFKNLTEDDLLVESKLYEVIPLGIGFYEIKQVKIYTKARLFSAILKVEDGIVVNYFVLNDFNIKDVKIVDSSLYVIADDYENKNAVWSYKGLVKMIKLSLGFNQSWVYTITAESALEGLEVKYSEISTTWKVNVMPGSSMVYNYFELNLNDLGEFQSVKWIESYEGTNAVSEVEMNEIFKNNLTK